MATPGLLLETHIDIGKQRVDGAIAREWDILKSIVYGGLIESILTLGLVSSAASADATTLKIVGLGVANLISGLFVIVHNLRELKNDPHSSMDQGGKLDRYQATLGRRESFRLHATVAVLSYILFGLLPPVIYGFSFWKSDNKEYKLIAVAAASLLCITVLGKSSCSRGIKKICENCTILRRHRADGIRSLLCSRNGGHEVWMGISLMKADQLESGINYQSKNDEVQIDYDLKVATEIATCMCCRLNAHTRPFAETIINGGCHFVVTPTAFLALVSEETVQTIYVIELFPPERNDE